MAITARIGPDHTCQIQLPASILVPFFQRSHASYCAKLTQIQSGWSGQGLAKHIWSGSQPVCWKHSVCMWASWTFCVLLASCWYTFDKMLYYMHEVTITGSHFVGDGFFLSCCLDLFLCVIILYFLYFIAEVKRCLIINIKDNWATGRITGRINWWFIDWNSLWLMLVLFQW